MERKIAGHLRRPAIFVIHRIVDTAFDETKALLLATSYSFFCFVSEIKRNKTEHGCYHHHPAFEFKPYMKGKNSPYYFVTDSEKYKKSSPGMSKSIPSPIRHWYDIIKSKLEEWDINHDTNDKSKRTRCVVQGVSHLNEFHFV